MHIDQEDRDRDRERELVELVEFEDKDQTRLRDSGDSRDYFLKRILWRCVIPPCSCAHSHSHSIHPHPSSAYTIPSIRTSLLFISSSYILTPYLHESQQDTALQTSDPLAPALSISSDSPPGHRPRT